MAHIASLYRYPVKAFSAQPLASVTLTAGEGVPFDRVYAVENGPSRFDPGNPKWLPKINFLTLMRQERLATLDTAFDEETHTFTILREGSAIARGQLNTRLGRQMIEQCLAAYFKNELKGPPRIVSAEGHRFTDIAAKAVHLVNLETVRALSEKTGIALNPLRFRANIYFEGVPPQAELSWIGGKLRCGDVELNVFDSTTRCAATDVDPASGARGASVPSAMRRLWDHSELGVYATVAADGTLAVGDVLSFEASKV